MNQRHAFDAVKPTSAPGRFTMDVEPEHCAWGGGRYFVMGGVGVAATFDAMETIVDRPLVTSSTQFVSFATVGETLIIDTEVLAVGRNISQARATVRTDDRIVLTTTAAFGARPDQPAATYVTMPEVPGPGGCLTREMEWPDIPNFHDLLEQREVPDADAEAGRSQCWTRPLAGPTTHPGFLAVVADHLPSVTHRVIDAENNTNSLDNVLRFHAADVTTDWVLMDQRLTAYGDGTFHAEGSLFAEDGTLLVSAGQSGIIRFPAP